MKIAIDMGHSLNSFDYGAVGIKKESEETRKVGNLVIKKLEAMGHTVVNCTVDTATSLNQSLSTRVARANASKIDLFVSIHFNAFNKSANGVEVFTDGGHTPPAAGRILNNIVKLGYANRGIKDGSKLYVVHRVTATSMLVECCFIDNSGDMAKYNPETMATAIANGIAGK